MKSLHIMHPHPHSEMVPIPLVLYITEDLMADEAHTSQDIAELLLRDVAYGVEQVRKAHVQGRHDKHQDEDLG